MSYAPGYGRAAVAPSSPPARSWQPYGADDVGAEATRRAPAATATAPATPAAAPVADPEVAGLLQARNEMLRARRRPMTQKQFQQWTKDYGALSAKIDAARAKATKDAADLALRGREVEATEANVGLSRERLGVEKAREARETGTSAATIEETRARTAKLLHDNSAQDEEDAYLRSQAEEEADRNSFGMETPAGTVRSRGAPALPPSLQRKVWDQRQALGKERAEIPLAAEKAGAEAGARTTAEADAKAPKEEAAARAALTTFGFDPDSYRPGLTPEMIHQKAEMDAAEEKTAALSKAEVSKRVRFIRDEQDRNRVAVGMAFKVLPMSAMFDAHPTADPTMVAGLDTATRAKYDDAMKKADLDAYERANSIFEMTRRGDDPSGDGAAFSSPTGKPDAAPAPTRGSDPADWYATPAEANAAFVAAAHDMPAGSDERKALGQKYRSRVIPEFATKEEANAWYGQASSGMGDAAAHALVQRVLSRIRR